MECNKIYWWNLPQSVRDIVSHVIEEETLTAGQEDTLRTIALRVQWFNLPAVIRELKKELSDILSLDLEDENLIWYQLPVEVKALCEEVNA